MACYQPSGRQLVPAYICDECGAVTTEYAEYVYRDMDTPRVSRLCLRCDARITAADEYQQYTDPQS